MKRFTKPVLPDFAHFDDNVCCNDGAVPIAIGIGGLTAQTRRPLGLVIVGGLIISQVLTLFFTP